MSVFANTKYDRSLRAGFRCELSGGIRRFRNARLARVFARSQLSIGFCGGERITSALAKACSLYPDATRGSTGRRFVQLAVPPGDTTSDPHGHGLGQVRELQNLESRGFRQLSCPVRMGARCLPRSRSWEAGVRGHSIHCRLSANLAESDELRLIRAGELLVLATIPRWPGAMTITPYDCRRRTGGAAWRATHQSRPLRRSARTRDTVPHG